MNDKTPVRRALGRGLDALLPAAPTPATTNYGTGSVFVCAIEKIVPQKGQPRQYFDPTALEELTQSIREHGILEPLVVRRTAAGGDKFELIAGERRWRASQRAGLKEVLVVVKDVSPAVAFELALIENVQRADLNPVELAEALSRLLEEHGYTQEQLAVRVGKDRTTITNTLRLLKLPDAIRNKVMTGELSEGHARALLSAGDKVKDVADKVIAGKLSVRATEDLVRKLKTKSDPKKANEAKAKSASLRDLEARLTRALGAPVQVRDKNNKGEIAIPYADLDALDRLIEKLT